MRDQFTKQVLQDIASFNNRYLGGILANLFESHPELQEEIADSIIGAIAAKDVRGKMILPDCGKEVFRSSGKMVFR